MTVKCVEGLIEAFPTVDEKVIQDIVKKMDELRGDPQFKSKAKLLRDETVGGAVRAAEFQAKQVLARVRSDQFMSTPEFNGSLKNNQDAFLAKFQGVDHLVKGGNDSFMQTRQTIEAMHLGNLHDGVRDIMEVIQDGSSDIEIANAIQFMNQKKSISGFPVHVQKAATAIKTLNTSLIRTLQDSGVIIKERADFISRQTHNREKILAVKFDEWYGKIEGKLDKNKTFGLKKESEYRGILRGIYDEIISGKMENNIGQFGGKRSLHFKDGGSWAEYNADFGHGTLIDTVVATTSSASKAAAASRVFGPDSKAIWNRMEKQYGASLSGVEKAKWEDKGVGGFARQRDNWFKEMFGHDRHAGREVVAKTTRAVNTVTAGAKLGAVLPTTLTDTTFSAMNLRAAGGGGMDAEFKVVDSFLKNLPKNERNKWLRRSGMYFDSLKADAFDRYGSFAGGGQGGAILKFSRKMVTWSGLEAQSAVQKAANARLFSLNLGDNAGKSWSNMDARTRAGLERFNIDEADWNIMRQAPEDYGNGDVGINMESLEAMSNDAFGGSKNKTDVVIKTGNYLADMSKVGSPEASGRERATITQGFSPDDPMGGFLRMAGQFKSFSLAMPRILRRISQSNPDLKGKGIIDALRGQGDGKLLAATMVEATLIAGVGLMIKDALKGKSRDKDGAFWLEAFTSSALPLAASYTVDAMRGEYDKFGRSIFKDLAGPSIGQIDEVVSLLSGAVSMDSKTGVRATKFIMNNTPGLNLPFVKVGINKLFLSEMQEAVRPGYEARLRGRANREGTDFIFNPF